MENIKVLELFSGYGGANFALKKAGLEHQCVGYSDIEKCANYIYAFNHGDDIPQLGDITKINPEDLPDFDLITGGFPCQSFSIAGKREGFASKDKGNLFFEIIRIAGVKKPRRMLLENVQGILSHDNGKTMEVVLRELKKIGYYVNWKLLFSKEHGTPQNRPRVWFACFREKEDYDNFIFPEKEELKIKVKDLLENEVDNKYYLNEQQLLNIENRNRYGDHKLEYGDTIHPTLCSIGKSDVAIIPEDFKIVDFRYDDGIRQRKNNICPTLSAKKSEGGLSGCPIISEDLLIADFRNDKGALIKNDGICHTLTSRKHSHSDMSTSPPMIMDNKTKNINESGVCHTIRSGNGSGNNINISEEPECINTITTGYGRQGSSKEFQKINEQINTNRKKWRRLTPKECFRLMGFFHDEIKFGNLSDSRLYFLAGNGWDINLASKIFIQMFKGNILNTQQTLGDFI